MQIPLDPRLTTEQRAELADLLARRHTLEELEQQCVVGQGEVRRRIEEILDATGTDG